MKMDCYNKQFYFVSHIFHSIQLQLLHHIKCLLFLELEIISGYYKLHYLRVFPDGVPILLLHIIRNVINFNFWWQLTSISSFLNSLKLSKNKTNGIEKSRKQENKRERWITKKSKNREKSRIREYRE